MNNLDLIGNYKRLLCKNMVRDKYCKYGTKCLYAHSLDEQKIDPLRQQLYEYQKTLRLPENIEKETIDKLYLEAIILSKVCDRCSSGCCIGGHNCRNGAVDVDHIIALEIFRNDIISHHNHMKPQEKTLESIFGKKIEEFI